ncbi:MAG: ABC transporter ATP-binding protein [Firmicutes bacterium]|nr:ABC transporter ATP-binding protein [Bacillota bacterium]
MNAIELKKLTKYYGKARGIIDVDLVVNKGDFFGFIGPNGAGKSTSIRTILGLISPNSGSATVLGHDIIAEKKEILSKVGYLPSEAIFYHGMKVKDVLKLSADLREMDCAEEAKKLCERLQLDMNRKVNELSFGNRKKVAIVAALQHKPELYILDEPTSGLDPLMQREFFEIMKEKNEEGATVFLSSHILSEIQKNCNRAAIIREGKIIACDTVDSLGKTSAKRVSVTGTVNVDDLAKLVDVRDIKSSAVEGEDTNTGLNFLYGGEINDLVAFLGGFDISDLNVSEPDLEDIFMHYYEGGE